MPIQTQDLMMLTDLKKKLASLVKLNLELEIFFCQPIFSIETHALTMKVIL